MEHEILYVIIGLLMTIILILYFKLQSKHKQDMDELKEDHKKILASSKNTQRSVLKGKIHEQMAPLFPEFYEKYEASDARFLGSPIDYVIFKNLSKFDKMKKDNEPIEVVLVDVKTGKNTLEKNQKAIQDAINEKRVSFEVIRPKIDED
ncbi:MAG: endonuclease [Nitrosopumilus sp.]|nr:endonuclease [Nitrosopumilus sp.]